MTVEDHYPEGGLGSAVADVVASRRDIILKKLAVREVPRSGPPKVRNCIKKWSFIVAGFVLVHRNVDL